MTIRARGPRPPADVWERYARVSSWSSWSPQIRGVECPVERLGAGVGGAVVGPLGVRARFVVTSWDDSDRRWSWKVALGPVRVQLTHGVDGVDAGTETWLTVRGALPIVLGYLPLARLALHRLVH